MPQEFLVKNPFRKILVIYKLKARRTNYILLFSHMRGYTSLLSHIIGSHSEVKGYTEMHQSYRTFLGLLKLRYKSKLTTSSMEVPNFLFDKLLHNKYNVSKGILQQRHIYPIIMIRKPEPTMKSILNMGEKYTKVVRWYRDEQKVQSYYIKRLQKLQIIAKRANGKALFLEGQTLIDAPEKALQVITTHLGLQSPLSKEYDTFSLTGAQGAGDPSSNIKSGKIVKDRDAYESIKISPELLAQAEAVYQQTVVVLQSNCKTI